MNERNTITSLLGLDPNTYDAHRLHSPQRIYAETNCYTDVIIELLHARGEEPLAAMAAAVDIDFEGDQWTFFKPSHDELRLLYGIDVHEMQPYRPLPEQIVEQIRCGRTLTVEFDAWFLPDTVATSYRREHVKSSAAIEAIDQDREILRYFHATGLHQLEDDDYRGVFRIDTPTSEWLLPPYTELVRFDANAPLRGSHLLGTAKDLLIEHMARSRKGNPFERFGAQLEHDLPRLLASDDANYHAYAFATVRMAGSTFEVVASYVDWLMGDRARAASEAFLDIVEGCKRLSLKLARRREFDSTELTAALASSWEQAMTALEAVLARGTMSASG